MKKADKKFIVDTFIFALFIILAATGLFLYFKLPPGSHGAVVWGLSRHTWGDIHFWVAVVFLTFIAYHLILNWNWIICMIKGRYKDINKQNKNITFAVIAIFLLLVISILPFLSSVNDSTKGSANEINPGRGRGQNIERNK